MDHAVIVIGHGKARNLHLNIAGASELSKSACEVVAVTPRNDPLKLYPLEFLVGNSDYNGIGTQDRTVFAITLAATMRTDTVTLLEYDAIAWPRYFRLATQILKADVVPCCHVFRDNNPKFTGHTFTHWPVTASPVQWKAIAKAASQLLERGFPDRLVGAAVQGAGYELKAVTETTFSCNNIGHTELDWALTAIRNGACAMHGIKSLDILKQLDQEYRKNNPTQ